MTSTQTQPSKAALDSLSSRLWDNSKRGNALPPLGTRTVGVNPTAQRAVIVSSESTSPQDTFSSSSSSTSAAVTISKPLPPVEQLPCPRPLSADQINEITFEAPTKLIVSQAHLEKWQHSDAFKDVLGFIMSCNDSVVGKKLTDLIKGEDSPAVKSIIAILDRVAILVKETPAEENSASRFGNPAFRTLYLKIQQESPSMHERIPGMRNEAIVEVERYFIEGFGNEKRIDYGSGMELNFACWLLCLVKLGVLDMEKEAPAVVLCIFWKYINVMRDIQSTYWLEPAGSHGVWGLDDYHFLPFLFGSSQLRSHKYFKPKAIHDQEILDEFYKEYMYFACIRFINGIKTASLRWHSPMLDDISGVRTWAKVNEGMMKMYKAEVLLKLPITQHIFFGSLIAFPPVSEEDLKELEASAEQDEHGHIHAHGTGQEAGWGDCCGIPIPSVFAAAQEEQKQSTGIRRIPFD